MYPILVYKNKTMMKLLFQILIFKDLADKHWKVWAADAMQHMNTDSNYYCKYERSFCK